MQVHSQRCNGYTGRETVRKAGRYIYGFMYKVQETVTNGM